MTLLNNITQMNLIKINKSEDLKYHPDLQVHRNPQVGQEERMTGATPRGPSVLSASSLFDLS